MDESLSRGYAKAHLSGLPDGDATVKRMQSQLLPGAAVKPMHIYRKEVPVDPVAKVLRRYQQGPSHVFFPAWSPLMRQAVALLVVRMQTLDKKARDHNGGVEQENSAVLLRTEATVLEPVAYGHLTERFHMTTGWSASLSCHAIARMLRRKASTPQSLADDVQHALVLADSVHRHAQITHTITRHSGGTFLLPFAGGALVASATRGVFPDDNEGNTPHLAIRTFLDAAKLSPTNRARVDALNACIGSTKADHISGFFSKKNTPAPNGPSLESWRIALEVNVVHEEFRVLSERRAERTSLHSV